MRQELRIESEDACVLASELVALTGESLQWAVVTALRERFERERARRDWQDQVMAITRDIATGLREPAANDHTARAGGRAMAG
jgi:hypothetical protein